MINFVIVAIISTHDEHIDLVVDQEPVDIDIGFKTEEGKLILII